MSMRVIAGCDGGGTKCEVEVAVFDGNKRTHTGRGVTGPANVASDLELALENIAEAFKIAAYEAGLPEGVRAIRFVAALAGAGKPDIQAACRNRLLKLQLSEEVAVVADAAVLFSTSQFVGPAIACVIGTGSIAWGRKTDGTLIRSGGDGPSLPNRLASDPGSGRWIACQMLRQICEFAESGQEVEFESQLELAFPNFTPQELLRTLQDSASKTTTRKIAALTRDVFALELASPIAQRVVSQAVEEIGKMIIAVSSHLETSEPRTWICTGGVACHQPAFIDRIQQYCSDKGVKLRRPIMVSNPVAGAVKLARNWESIQSIQQSPTIRVSSQG